MYKIIWLTGHSGTGKTTIARSLSKEIGAIVLDGDEMRDSISFNCGFSKENRKEHNLRVSRLARELSKQIPIIVSVIAPIINVRKEIDKICSPIWIYCKKNVPERENHFYEIGDYNFIIDNDKYIVNENVCKIKEFLNKYK